MIRKIRYGMIGGGRGAFIGGVHRIAAAIDGQIELACGAFSSDPQKSRDSGADLFLPPERCYGTFEEMIKAEAALPKDKRMDFVVIVTPNHMHFPAAKLALEYGFHVLCDKPATFSLDEAKELKVLVKKSGKFFCLTHNYSGYPLIKEAKQMIAEGKLGKIRKVVAEYPQGWLATLLESTGQKQASWRTDPALCGLGGCMGDIGSHALHLAEYVTGLKIEAVSADITTFVPGRKEGNDDDANGLLRFAGGAKGIFHCSQVSVGCENNLALRVYGELGGIEWSQLDPNTLIVKTLDQPDQIFRRGGEYLGAAAKHATRIPAGHPEGYLEGFANIYGDFIGHIRAIENGTQPTSFDLDYPSVEEAVQGMAHIEAVVKSSNANSQWVNIASLLE